MVVETSFRHLQVTAKFPMLQPPSPLLEMASLRLPDSDEFDVDSARRRSDDSDNAPATTASASPSGGGTLLQMRHDLGDYLSNLITEAIATSPRAAIMDDQGVASGGQGVHGLFNASKTDVANLSAIEQTPDRLYRHSMAMSAVYCVAYVVVFVVGLIGNSFVIAVVYRSPRMRTVTNFFIVNLAVADVLVIVFCLPATLMSNIFVREYTTLTQPSLSLFLSLPGPPNLPQLASNFLFASDGLRILFVSTKKVSKITRIFFSFFFCFRKTLPRDILKISLMFSFRILVLFILFLIAHYYTLLYFITS